MTGTKALKESQAYTFLFGECAGRFLADEGYESVLAFAKSESYGILLDEQLEVLLRDDEMPSSSSDKRPQKAKKTPAALKVKREITKKASGSRRYRQVAEAVSGSAHSGDTPETTHCLSFGASGIPSGWDASGSGSVVASGGSGLETMCLCVLCASCYLIFRVCLCASCMYVLSNARI